MKLIRELNEDTQILNEVAEDGTKTLYIEGKYLQSAVKNKNGRIYPEEIMDKEVARYIKEAIDQGTAWGELGHPNSPAIGLKEVSHRIVSLRKEGTDYYGKAMITNTPMGNIAKGLIESGGKLGVSSRALGSVKPNRQGINEVQADFRLATAADIVADPSAHNAFVNGIMESADWVYDDRVGWQMIELLETTQKEIDEAVVKRELEEKKFALFEAYINKLSKIIL